jgi:hypothetical protein
MVWRRRNKDADSGDAAYFGVRFSADYFNFKLDNYHALDLVVLGGTNTLRWQ